MTKARGDGGLGNLKRGEGEGGITMQGGRERVMERGNQGRGEGRKGRDGCLRQGEKGGG